MSIEAKNITKTFGQFSALKGVDLKVDTGELVALLGPSGSGKTTLLRIIAGLEEADSGEILFHGEDMAQRKVGDRQVGFVFQHYALFRHMSVFENVAFGLRVRPRSTRPSNKEIQARVLELLKLVQLEGLAGRRPSQLSGGQRQRVAIARSLVNDPAVLLVDEPTSALDAERSREIVELLERMARERDVAVVMVTHDQEALRAGTRLREFALDKTPA